MTWNTSNRSAGMAISSQRWFRKIVIDTFSEEQQKAEAAILQARVIRPRAKTKQPVRRGA